jgi:hypothetical protein
MTHAPDTREHHILMARIYLHQARATIHRSWAFTLLAWAAERRLKAMKVQTMTKQMDLFNA